MKKTAKKAIRDERGAALILTLVVLLVGGLIMAPLLGYMGTGHIAGGVHEKRMDELYAADAGVERAIWQIANDPSANVEPISVNDKDVEIEIDMLGCREYRIISEATTPGVSRTIITSSVFMRTLWDSALATQSTLFIKDATTIVGDIWMLPDKEIKTTGGADIDHTGGIVGPDHGDWPSEDEVDAFASMLKSQALEKDDIRPAQTIDSSSITLGPTYFEGNIKFTKDVILTIQGTVYVEGSIDVEKDLTILGNGSIVARDDIVFKKDLEWLTEGDNTIMSINENIEFRHWTDVVGLIFAPAGSVIFGKETMVHGAVVAVETITSQSNFTVTYDQGIGDREELWLMGQGRWIVQTWIVDLQTLAGTDV